MKRNTNCNYHSLGSILHRLKSFESYDSKLFDKLYIRTQPFVRRYAKQINSKKLGISRDIIESFLTDKFLLVFNTYHKKLDEEQLTKAIVKSLNNYKKKLWEVGELSGMGEFNKSGLYLEEMVTEKKIENEEEHHLPDEIFICDNEIQIDHTFSSLVLFMRERLTPEEYLVFDADLYLKQGDKKPPLTDLVKLFELPDTRTSFNILKKYRNTIDYWLNEFSNLNG
jgi:hypothetical protein